MQEKRCFVYIPIDIFQKLPADDHLVWDKDDEAAMTFVTSCANIRANIFHIALKSRFDVKSMAGNIIPAIATTNAVIGGLIVLEALKILMGNEKACKTVSRLILLSYSVARVANNHKTIVRNTLLSYLIYSE